VLDRGQANMRHAKQEGDEDEHAEASALQAADDLPISGCPICEGEGWVCEVHPLTSWTCGCGGPGIPCRCNPAQKMPPGFRTLSSVSDNDLDQRSPPKPAH
jgi:hypothetical protein